MSTTLTCILCAHSIPPHNWWGGELRQYWTYCQGCLSSCPPDLNPHPLVCVPHSQGRFGINLNSSVQATTAVHFRKTRRSIVGYLLTIKMYILQQNSIVQYEAWICMNMLARNKSYTSHLFRAQYRAQMCTNSSKYLACTVTAKRFDTPYIFFLKTY